MNGIIIAESFYNNPRTSISRAFGAHKVATLLRKNNIEVQVIDFFNDWDIKELQIIINSYKNLTFLGISSTFDSLLCEKVNLLISIVKDKFPDIKVISGGGYITTTNFKGVDYYFKGFVEGAVDEIINYLRNGKINPFVVNTLKVFDDKKVIDCYKHYPTYDLDNFKTNYVESDFIQEKEGLSIELSRGCIFKCKFCNFPLVGKKKNDYIRDKEDIKKEIISNYNNYKITNYSIVDDTFNDNQLKIDMLNEISQELDFQINYICYTRVDLLHAKPRTLDTMVKSGVKAMFFGIETLNEITGKLIGKGFCGDKLKKYLLEIRQKYPRLHLTGSFIVGLPEESLESVRNNIEWCLDNNIFNCIYLYPLGIPKNTYGNLTSTFSVEWEKYNYTNMSVTEIKKFIENNIEYSYMNNNDFESKQKHYILWKNSYMNFIEAVHAAMDINSKINPKTTLGGWNCFTSAHTGYTLEEMLQLKKNKINWNSVIEKTQKFVSNYKTKKIDFINSMNDS